MLTPKVLTDKYTESVYRLFQEKEWEIEQDGSLLNTFDRFCQRMAELECDEDRDFILELSKDYLWIRAESYETLLVESLKKWFDQNKFVFSDNEMLYICPLLPKKHFRSNKSSKYMLYLCQTTALRKLPEFHENEIRLFDNPGLLKDYLADMKCLILIDDYIGSGETGIGCLDYIKSIGIDMKKVFIISLVAQLDGVNELKKQGVQVFSMITRTRGISDKYFGQEMDTYLAKMRKIGRTIQAQRNIRLGYSASEALVTMIKTPNNTFPFYWYEKDANAIAPFPRRKNIAMVSEVVVDEE